MVERAVGDDESQYQDPWVDSVQGRIQGGGRGALPPPWDLKKTLYFQGFIR